MTAHQTRVYDLTVRDVAARLGVHPESVKRWARAGKLDARKNMAGAWLFNRQDVDRVQTHVVVER